MKKTALFFSPEGGSVNDVAIKLGTVIGNDKVVLIPLKRVGKEDLNNYDQIIFLGSTVGADHWSNEAEADEWHAFFSKMKDETLKNKKVAIIGLGNSVLYPEHFVDGMAYIHKKVTEMDAKVFGFVSGNDYDFTGSEAVNDDGLFCGLPIDEDNEDDLTNERLKKWIVSLQSDFTF